MAISLLGKEELCFSLLLLLLVCFWCPKHFLSHNNVLDSIVCLRIGREMGKACLRGSTFSHRSVLGKSCIGVGDLESDSPKNTVRPTTLSKIFM